MNNSKKIILVVASQGFQPHEYFGTKEVLENAGLQVLTASNKIGIAHSSDERETQVDMLVSDIDPELADGLFFIGGPGAMDHLNNETSYQVLRKWQESGKPFGAICISPRILAHAGVLKGKKATGWNGDSELEGVFSEFNVNLSNENVIIDENIITANGPEAAEDFGRAIAGLFS